MTSEYLNDDRDKSTAMTQTRPFAAGGRSVFPMEDPVSRTHAERQILHCGTGEETSCFSSRIERDFQWLSRGTKYSDCFVCSLCIRMAAHPCSLTGFCAKIKRLLVCTRNGRWPAPGGRTRTGSLTTCMHDPATASHIHIVPSWPPVSSTLPAECHLPQERHVLCVRARRIVKLVS